MGTSDQNAALSSLQEQFLRSSFVGMSDEQILELLLSLFLPSDQAKERARLRIQQFKDIRAFLKSSRQELERVGVSRKGRLVIKILNKLPAEILKRDIIQKPAYKSSREFFDYLYYSMRDSRKEVFKVIYVDNGNHITEIADVAEGTEQGIPINPREIIESATRHSAAGLVFVHNHPAGDPTPSRSDRQITRDLVFMGNILEIKVLDHIIIGGNRYFSFADEGLIDRYNEGFLTLRLRAFESHDAHPVTHRYFHATALAVRRH